MAQQIHRTRQQVEDAMWREAFGIIARCIVVALAAALLVTWGGSTESFTHLLASAATSH